MSVLPSVSGRQNGDQNPPVALLLIDVINHFEFPEGDKLLAQALPMAPRLAKLKQRARRAGIPCIYINDNFGQWRSNFSQLLERCLREDAPGRKFVEQLKPDQEDYLVLKPKHSAFFQTPLETLLQHLRASHLIVCGLATTSCLVSTVYDANMREFELSVPEDCSAAYRASEHRHAIQQIAQIRNASTTASSSLRLNTLIEKVRRRG